MIGIILLVSLAIFFSFLIALLSDVLKVEEDERVNELTKLLPGYNCGACGKSGCFFLAKDIIEKGEDYNLCKLLKDSRREKIKTFLNENID